MIRNKTVFILGAGASAPYNFPVGLQLTTLVLNGLREGTSLWRELAQMGIPPAAMEEFRLSLHASGRYSIDAFLQFRPEFMDVGKAAMAYVLIEREDETSLHSVSPQTDWYRYIFNRISGPPNEMHSNGVSFITFNYDRSLEQFLFNSFQNSFGLHSEDVATLLSSIPIIHLHGDLGLLPWQGDSNTRPYISDTSPRYVMKAMSRMNIIHDDMKPRKQLFDEALALLREADRRYFLGFSYDPINMERLQINTVFNFHAQGTAYGLMDGEIRGIERRHGNSIELSDLECLTFLKRVALLD